MKKLVKILEMIILFFVIALLMTLPTMWLWNWLMPMIFGLMKLNFWQAFGVNFLASILFKNSSSNSNND